MDNSKPIHHLCFPLAFSISHQAEAVLHLLEGPTELLTNLFRHFRLSSPGLNRYEMVSQLSVR